MVIQRATRQRATRTRSLQLGALAALALAAATPAQNCAQTSIGQTPLDDPAGGTYFGHSLGLWPGSSNTPPPAHRAAGLQQMQAVAPLDANGAPSASGRIVVLSIGMSNTTQEFSTWMPISNADPLRNGSVTLVDGAQGGQHAAIVANPTAAFWTVVGSRLAAAGVTAQQVQVVWLKEAMAGPTAAFPGHALQLRDDLGQIARNLKTFYPNVKLCFLSSRIYAGYATSSLNPEPFAYESAFSVRWVIEQQSTGDPALNFDPAAGSSVAPWLGWGPYTWADGTTPRAGDGLSWSCSDYQADGTHPGSTGRNKVAAMLDAFFSGSEFTTPWYRGSGPVLAAFTLQGVGCPGTTGIPQIVPDGLPVLGNLAFRVGIRDAAPNRLALLLMSTGAAALPVTGSCTLLVDPTQLLPGPLLTTNALGRALVSLPVPNDAALSGLEVRLQWGNDDPLGAPFAGFAGLSATGAGIARIGL